MTREASKSHEMKDERGWSSPIRKEKERNKDDDNEENGKESKD